MGLLGDVHAEDLRLEVALAWFRTEVDEIACVGDVVDGLGSDETCVVTLDEARDVTARFRGGAAAPESESDEGGDDESTDEPEEAPEPEEAEG